MLTEVLSSAFPRRDAVPTVNGKRSGSDRDATRRRLAIIVSHPIQYYVPLYQRLAQRPDLDVKVFFTWHAATAAVHDHGFRTPVAWDIPLTEGYAFELVPNQASDPGTHHFFGLRNPTLVARVTAWQPDVIHLTGWAWLSHLLALRAFRAKFHSMVAESGLRTTDGSLGLVATGTLNVSNIAALVERMQDGLWELVSHPGYNDAQLAATGTRLRASRETEMQALTADNTRRALERNGIQLISFHELAPLAADGFESPGGCCSSNMAKKLDSGARS